MNVKDQTVDYYRALYIAAFPKAAALARPETGIDRPQEAEGWADPAAKAYPCHTPQATVASYFSLRAAKLLGLEHDSPYPEGLVESRLKEAALRQGVRERLNEVDRLLKDESREKVIWAIDEIEDGKPVRRYPLYDEETAKLAAAAFWANRAAYPYAWRRKAASRILDHLPTFLGLAAPIRNYLLCAAGRSPADPSTIAFRLQKRAGWLPLTERFKLASLATMLGDAKEVEHQKLAEIIDAADREEGYYQLYGQGFPMPEEIVYLAQPPANIRLGNREFPLSKVAEVVRSLASAVPSLRVYLSSTGEVDLERIADLSSKPELVELVESVLV